MLEKNHEKLAKVVPALVDMFLAKAKEDKIIDATMAHELGLNAGSTYTSKRKAKKFDYEQTIKACVFLGIDYTPVFLEALGIITEDTEDEELFLPVGDVNDMSKILRELPTKSDLANLATKDDMASLAKKERVDELEKTVEKLKKEMENIKNQKEE